MRVIARSTLKRFLDSLQGSKYHRALKTALDAWFHEARQAQWKNSADITASYAHANIVGANRVVFNIKGDACRLVVAVDYRRYTVFITWLGTHKEYDSIDVRTVQYATEANQD